MSMLGMMPPMSLIQFLQGMQYMNQNQQFGQSNPQNNLGQFSINQQLGRGNYNQPFQGNWGMMPPMMSMWNIPWQQPQFQQQQQQQNDPYQPLAGYAPNIVDLSGTDPTRRQNQTPNMGSHWRRTQTGWMRQPTQRMNRPQGQTTTKQYMG